jgi:glycosyltransferase involved in cell wall biosynthesis
VDPLVTKILDLDIEKLPHEINNLVDGERLFVIFRFRQVPIHVAWIEYSGTNIYLRELIKELWQSDLEVINSHRLLAFLELNPDRRIAKNNLKVSVVVCTRDRADDLKRCLEGLMQLPDDDQEYLVVDNCPPNDDTREIVASFGSRVRYIREERKGLDVARNRALEEAKNDIVAFIDDDAVPEENWLRMLVRNFSDPLVMCVTGLTLPIELQNDAQEWFERYSTFSRGFHRKVYDLYKINPLAAGHVGVGVNMALRREIISLIGPFDEALDAGTLTCSGGDTEMFSRILRAGYRIIYDPAAVNWHRHRKSWSSLRNTMYGYGVGTYSVWTRQLFYEREFGVILVAMNWLINYQIPDLLRSIIKRPKSPPFDLLIAELLGCLIGPVAYFRSRNIHRKNARRILKLSPDHQHHYSNP